MELTFWGVRGSVPTPGPSTQLFGGNTACHELRIGNRLVILDAGSGIRELGLKLAREMPVKADIFVTHTHWDHINGFPFFTPAFVPGNRLHFYGPAHFDPTKTLKKVIELQMDFAYFPVSAAQLAAQIDYTDLKEGEHDIDGLKVHTRFLNHPVHLLGYRIEAEGKVLVYTGDNEPYYDCLSDADEDDEEYIEEVRAAVREGNQKLVDFVRGADLLVADAQYTPEEYPSKRGWGHTAWDDTVRLAVNSGVKRLALWHHEPTRNDAGMAELEKKAQAMMKDLAPSIECFAAREGQTIKF